MCPEDYKINEIFKEKMIAGGYCPLCGDFLIPRKIKGDRRIFSRTPTGIKIDKETLGIKMECINPECDYEERKYFPKGE